MASPEQEPRPEKPEIEIVNHCDTCGNATFLNDENTIMFQGEDTKWYAYVRCDNECDAETIEIGPEVIEYFSYLTNWYTQEGKISDVEWTGVVLGQTEVIDVTSREWGEVMLNFLEIYQPQAWEFQKWQK